METKNSPSSPGWRSEFSDASKGRPSSRVVVIIGVLCVLAYAFLWSQQTQSVVVYSKSKSSSSDITYEQLFSLLTQQNTQLLHNYENRLSALENRDPSATPSSASSSTPSQLANVPHVLSAAPDSKSQLAYQIVNVESSLLKMSAKFAIMKQDAFVGATFQTGRWWEDDIIPSILAEFDKHDADYCNILDMGVNIGSHTIAYAMHLLKNSARYKKRCTVFGFEPQPGVFLAAITNVGLNGLGNVQLFNAATVHADGQTVTMGSKEDYGANIDFTESTRRINFGGLSLGSGGIGAKALKIDSLGFERVGLIKADIQGSEPMAFYGARELIKRDRPLIFYETGFASAEQMQQIVSAIKPGPVPPEAYKFDLWAFCQTLNYTQKAFSSDRLLIPL